MDNSQAENQWLLFALKTMRLSLARAKAAILVSLGCAASPSAGACASASKRRRPAVMGPIAPESSCCALDWYLVM